MSTEFLTLATLEFSSKLEEFCRTTLNAAGMGLVLLIRKESLRMGLWIGTGRKQYSGENGVIKRYRLFD